MRNSFAPVFDTAEDAKIAWKAVKEAEKHLPQWEAFLRMVGRDPKLKLRLTGGQPRTDGKTVYVQVPMALGRITEHTRKACGQRDKHGLQACEACRALESVFLTILHETAHIVFGTFAKVSDAARAQAVEDGIRLEARGQSETKRAAKIAKAIELAPDVFKKDFMNLAGLVSPYLPIIVNCIEDTRVNVAMTSARKGIRLMFEAWVMRYFREGTEGIDGKTYYWHDAPVNMQAIISIYCETSELTNYKAYLDPDVAAKLDDPEFLMLCERAKKIRHVSESYTLGVQLLECLRRMGFCLSPDDLMDEPEPEPQPSDDESENKDESEDEEQQPGQGDSSEPEDDGTGDGTQAPDTGQDRTDTDADDAGDSSPQDGDDGPDTGDKDNESDDQEGEAGDDDTGGAGSDDPADDGDESDEPGDTGDGAGESESDDDGDGADAEPEAASDDPGDPGSEGEGGEGEDDAGDPADQDGGPGDAAESGDQDDAGDGDDSPGSDGASDGSDGSGSDTSSGRDDDGGSEPAPSDGSSDGGAGSAGDADSSQDGGSQPEAGDGSGGGVTSGDYVPSPEPITPEQMEEMGTPEKVAELFAIFGGHAKPEDFEEKEDGEAGDDDEDGPATLVVENDNTNEEAEQIEVAIAQAQHFDHVSEDLEGLNVWTYPKDRGVYAFGSGDGYSRRSVPVEKPPATLLAGSIQKLRILFTENRRGAKQANLRKGKVDPKKLSRFATGDDRLFRKKSQPGKKDYFVVIGFDCSGSTGIGPLGYIKSSVAAMAEMMTRLGIKFSVQAHSGSGNHVEIFEIKGPNQPWNEKTYEALNAIKAFHCNLDGHALEYYRKQAQSQKATDKVIFFYTDGALNNIGEEYDVFTENVGILRQLGITCVGVEVNGDHGLAEVLGMDTVQIDGPEDTRKVVDKLEECLSQRVYA